MSQFNPPHPGEFIQTAYIEPLTISAQTLSSKLDILPSTLSSLLKGNGSVRSDMALRLSKALGRTPESWLAMQNHYDLWQKRQHATD